MNKNILIAVIVTVLITAILFILPRTVVENEPAAEAETTLEANANSGDAAISKPVLENREEISASDEEDHSGHDHEEHRPELSQATQAEVAKWAEKYKSAQKAEKIAIFADSLASLWANTGWYDSAAVWAEKAVEAESNVERLYKAGDYWYQAAGTMHDETVLVKRYQKRAAGYLEQVIAKNPKHSGARIRLAMTKVEGANPMEGITMLRQVLEEEPNNTEALFNMGMLSWQSQQFDKAVTRFKKLVSLEPDHLNGQFYLALSYIQLGENVKAKTHLQQVKRLNSNPEIQAAIEEYLNKL